MKKFIKIFLVLFYIFVVKSFSLENFGYRFTPEKDVYLFVQGNSFLIQPQSIISSGNMLYFAAQDFTKNREL